VSTRNKAGKATAEIEFEDELDEGAESSNVPPMLKPTELTLRPERELPSLRTLKFPETDLG
jgi:hypothetical protein